MKQFHCQKGLSLLEVLISIGITSVGVTGVALMMAHSIDLQFLSEELTRADTLARAKLEELHLLASDAPELAVGGDLASDVTDHHDDPVGFKRRWLVAEGPAGTLDVTVRVIPVDPTFGGTAAEIRGLLSRSTSILTAGSSTTTTTTTSTTSTLPG